MRLNFFVLFFVAINIVSCQKKQSEFNDTHIKQEFSLSHKNLKLLRAQAFDNNWKYQNSPLGGISGITYDSKNGRYIAISDDRGQYDDPRLFTFKISENTNEEFVTPTGVIYLLDKEGNRLRKDSVDFEGLALDEQDRLYVSNEGTNKNVTDVFVFDSNGKNLSKITPSKHYTPNPESTQTIGVRDNKGFESLAISPDQNFLFAGLEAPLIQDGERSNLTAGSFVRLLRFKKNQTSYEIENEYVYPLSPIPFPKNGTEEMRKEFKGSNGLVELIAFDDKNLWALERSYSSSLGLNHIDIFEVKISDFATNTVDLKSLQGNRWASLDKYLFASVNDFSQELAKLNVRIDNIEAMALGPKLNNGNQLLLLVSDNNFSSKQKTIFILFEILGRDSSSKGP